MRGATVSGYSFDFYPRPPRGGRRQRNFQQRRHKRHFYPRPPRGGRRKRKDWSTRMELISIHALREEGDVKVLWT